MSKFMDFLDHIDDDIINETYVDGTVEEEEPLVEMPTKKKKVVMKPKIVKKDSSVKLIEARIRTKLDNIGLNETAISDVVSFVLDDVQKVPSMTKSKSKKQSKKQPKREIVQEQDRMNTMIGRAESLLEGMPETSTLGAIPDSGESIDESNVNVSDVTSRASSLL